MKYWILLILLVFVISASQSQRQVDDTLLTIVKPLHSLSSGQHEYSPVFYKNKLHFISNRNYHFAMFMADRTSRNDVGYVFQPEKEPGSFSVASHLAHKINAKYNEGPFCFSSKGVYVTCNQYKMGFTGKPPLEIRFSAFSAEKGYVEAKRIPIDLPDTVSFGHPCLINDTLMVFAIAGVNDKSDVDLCFSVFKGKKWQEPLILGHLNSDFQDMYPTFNGTYLFFASNRPGGMGQMDIYRSKFDAGGFSLPELLPAPLNSPFDDFGIWTDPENKWGYFSSGRKNQGIDLYWFSNDPEIGNKCNGNEKPSYCFTFMEESALESRDTADIFYEWNFGDGTKSRGVKVQHCFSGPGSYKVDLNIIDKSTGAIFYNQVSYEFELEGDKVLYLEAPDSIGAGKALVFKPQVFARNNAKRHFSYRWDFGDRTRSFRSVNTHVYEKPGKYKVKLTAVERFGDTLSTMCVEKWITVLERLDKVDDYYLAKTTVDTIAPGHMRQKVMLEDEKGFYKTLFNVEESSSALTYKVHLGTSSKILQSSDSVFKGLSPISYNKLDNVYHYTYGEAKTLANSRQLYEEVERLGFENAFVIAFKGDSMIFGANMQHMMNSIYDNAKNTKKVNRDYSLVIFFSAGSITLSDEAKNQLLKLIDHLKSSGPKQIVIEGHTDGVGSNDMNDKISLQRAEHVRDFFKEKGLNGTELKVLSYGASRPLFPENNEKNKSYNRRVEIKVKYD